MGLTTTIPSIAIQKLIPILDTQIMKMFDISSYIEIAVNSLPLNVKCTDPRVRDIKQQLAKVKQLLANIDKIKKALAKLAKVFKGIAITALVIELVQLAIPAVPGVPQGPFAKIAIIAAILGVNCKSASKCLASIISSIDAAISALESVLAAAIMKLTSVCTNDVFETTRAVQAELIKISEISKSTNNTGIGVNGNGSGDGDGTGNYPGSFDGYQSNFYNEYNVSQDDLDDLETIVNDLNELELTIKDYLLEAPSDVLQGNIPPANDLGKIGDYYIDLTAQQIYGPKTSDDDWSVSPITVI